MITLIASDHRPYSAQDQSKRTSFEPGSIWGKAVSFETNQDIWQKLRLPTKCSNCKNKAEQGSTPQKKKKKTQNEVRRFLFGLSSPSNPPLPPFCPAWESKGAPQLRPKGLNLEAHRNRGQVPRAFLSSKPGRLTKQNGPKQSSPPQEKTKTKTGIPRGKKNSPPPPSPGKNMQGFP